MHKIKYLVETIEYVEKRTCEYREIEIDMDDEDYIKEYEELEEDEDKIEFLKKHFVLDDEDEYTLYKDTEIEYDETDKESEVNYYLESSDYYPDFFATIQLKFECDKAMIWKYEMIEDVDTVLDIYISKEEGLNIFKEVYTGTEYEDEYKETLEKYSDEQELFENLMIVESSLVSDFLFEKEFGFQSALKQAVRKKDCVVERTEYDEYEGSEWECYYHRIVFK